MILGLLLAAAVQSANTPAAPQMIMHRPAPPAVSGTDSCLPLKFADGMPVIEAAIGDRRISFGFDTGAPGGPILDPAIIATLKALQVGEARMTDPSLKNVVSVPIYELNGLKIGGLTFGTWTVTGRPKRETRRLAEPDGIIGLTAFAGYIVTIDYPGGRMKLTKGRLPEGDGRTSFTYGGPIPRVPLSIDGKEIDAHLDTGNARYSLIVPENYAAQLPGYTDRFPIGIARTINNTYNLMAFPVRETKVGEIALYAGTAAFPGPSARGNIGSQLLRDFVVKIDPANGIVALERAKPGLENGCPSA